MIVSSVMLRPTIMCQQKVSLLTHLEYCTVSQVSRDLLLKIPTSASVTMMFLSMNTMQKYYLRTFLLVSVRNHRVDGSLPKVKTCVQNIGNVREQLLCVNIQQFPRILQSMGSGYEHLVKNQPVLQLRKIITFLT